MVSRSENNSRDIMFNPNSNATEIPEDQLKLQSEIEKTLVVLRGITKENNERFERYFVPLLSLAQAGLVGETAQPKLSLQALETLQSEIVANEGGRIKNGYLIRLGSRALGAVSVILLLLLGFWNFYWTDFVSYASHFFVLVSGCTVGVWLSFGVRKKKLNFYNLNILEEDQLEPMIRIIFASLLTFLVGLVFSTRLVTIKFGGIETWQFTESYEIALLFGLLLGFSEQALPDTVAKQASKLVNL